MARKMTQEEWRAFGRRPARAPAPSAGGGDGSPHTPPICFVPTAGALVFTTGEKAVKGRNPAP
ncbi:hypothetical protein [Streptomyces lavendulae]|uniref:hypothetical protein n=1 Tax=Streptomyces lavendulae TaxID=1914 RepID=UPI0024A27403|nr:hypothetical protein [Streptomyces lavendulae]GLX16658.1 hypothetical protein Slala01_03020 [Streptomyces lavendulae subsp. lavendulae]GLX25279.1 hypothetical protein Slala02_10990 [Streptomyces lavendulae subsp. lavendulae]